MHAATRTQRQWLRCRGLELLGIYRSCSSTFLVWFVSCVMRDDCLRLKKPGQNVVLNSPLSIGQFVEQFSDHRPSLPASVPFTWSTEDSQPDADSCRLWRSTTPPDTTPVRSSSPHDSGMKAVKRRVISRQSRQFVLSIRNGIS